MEPIDDLTRRSGGAVATAGEVMRSLKPLAIGICHLIEADDDPNQGEIAESLGCARSTVSKHLQTLKALRTPVVEKRGQRYDVTPTGHRLLDAVDSAARTYGIDLDGTWSTRHVDDFEGFLSPLHDSRSAGPYFVLESLSVRSGVYASVDRPMEDLDGGLEVEPAVVAFDSVVEDVRSRHAERDTSTDRELIRQTVERFAEKGVVDQDGGHLAVTAKGVLHCWLLEAVIEALSGAAEEPRADERQSIFQPQSMLPAWHSRRAGYADAPPTAGALGLLGDRPGTPGGEPVIVPCYCTVDEDGPTPRFVMEGVTVGELFDHAGEQLETLGEDALLTPYWSLVTTNDVYPLEPAVQPLGVAERLSWLILAEAHELVEREVESAAFERGEIDPQALLDETRPTGTAWMADHLDVRPFASKGRASRDLLKRWRARARRDSG